MFCNVYSGGDRRVKTCFFGILNLNVNKATQIMKTLNLFFESKQIILERVLFSVFDGTNAI